MSTVDVTPAENDVPKNYLNNGLTLRSWLLTLDHKRIGILYLISITIFFLFGGASGDHMPPGLDDARRPTCCRRRLTTNFSRCTAS